MQAQAPNRRAIWWPMLKRAVTTLPMTVRAIFRRSTPSLWASMVPAEHARYSDAALDALRKRGDPPVDDVIRQIADDAARVTGDPSAGGAAVLQLIRALAARAYVVPETMPDPVQRWLPVGLVIPADLEYERMERAREFFANNAFVISLIYGTSSLLEAYACPRGMRVLAYTQRLKDDPYRRLAETLQWALMVEDPDGTKAEGHAGAAIAKVRLMHAAIRYLASRQPDWDEAELGVPINAEDLLGTLMSFSAIVIRDLPKLGVHITDGEAEDRIYYWNVVGRMLGIDEDLLPRSAAEARQIVDTIKRRQQGAAVRRAVPQGVAEGRRFAAALVEFHRAMMPGQRFDHVALKIMRRVAGDEICDLLEVPRPDATPVPADRYDEASMPDDWGSALITRQRIEVPGETRRGTLWTPPKYVREAPYEIPTSIRARWDRGKVGWQSASERLRA